MAPKKPVKKTVVKKTAAKKPPMGPAKVGTTAEYRALAAENAAKKNLTQTASSILTKNATNASNALKAKDAARAVTPASKVGKASSTLGKIAKFAKKKSVVGAVALTAGASLVDYLNKGAKQGKTVAAGGGAGGKGGSTTGFIPGKKSVVSAERTQFKKVLSEGLCHQHHLVLAASIVLNMETLYLELPHVLAYH